MKNGEEGRFARTLPYFSSRDVLRFGVFAEEERMLWVEWPALAECIHQKLMHVKQIASGTVPVYASCLLVVVYKSVRDRRYLPPIPLILGRVFHYCQDHQPVEGL